MHAAMIAVEVLRPHMAAGAKALTIADFMLEHPEDVKERRNRAMLALLETEAIKAERAERRSKKEKP